MLPLIDAINKLSNYNGTNPYLQNLKYDVINYNKTNLTDFQIEYVLKNYDKEVKFVDKLVNVAEWWGTRMKKEWALDFVIKKIIVVYIFGETDKSIHCAIKYKQTQDKLLFIFLPKTAIIGEPFAEDFNKLEVDFSKYTKDGFVPVEAQKQGVKFLLSRKKAILSLDKGLGKTATSIMAAIEGKFNKILITCPASLKTQWVKEIERFEDKDNITIVQGKNWDEKKFTIINYDILTNFYVVPKIKRKTTVNVLNENGVIETKEVVKEVKTNKKSVVDEALNLSSLYQANFDLIIIDEAHRLSNKTSNMYSICEDLVKRSHPKGVFMLTATPIKNTPQNLYNLLKLIDAPIAKDWEAYHQRYCSASRIYKKNDIPLRNHYTAEFLAKINKNSWFDLNDFERKQLENYLAQRNIKKIWIMGEPSNLDELSMQINHLYFCKENQEVYRNIKKEVIYKRYDLSPEEKIQYKTAWDDYIKSHDEKNIDRLIQNYKLIEGSVFRQLCANFMISRTIETVNEEIRQGHRVLIFCCFDEELYTLQNYYKDQCVIYNGKLTAKKKDKNLKMFKENENIKVFIGNIDSASVGLNLNECSRIVFNNISFVPSDLEQCEGRITRLGQTKDVKIIYQLFNDTYMERMFEIITNKTQTISQIIKEEKYKNQ
jgi:SWI/SNF-related matrix-associated actin-dependent regulator 1 of chromatin subfamily A